MSALDAGYVDSETANLVTPDVRVWIPHIVVVFTCFCDLNFSLMKILYFILIGVSL